MSATGGQIGHYRIETPIARGGQGLVYAAEDTRLHRRVAVKILPPGMSLDRDALDRFRGEARTAASLDHPGICAIHEVGIDRGRRYIAMQLVEGRTLAEQIAATETPPSRPQVLRLVETVERVARAVHSAHEAGIIHRDLRPANIMLTPAGDPVVLNFGVTRDQQIDVSRSLSGDPFGTPASMAPELIEPRLGPADRRTDVYGLAATLYELLTLRPPFRAPTRQALYRAILSQSPPGVRRFNPASPRDLEIVLEKALAREQGHRYPTAQDLADELHRVRRQLPIRARRAGLLLRCRRWTQRNPILASSYAGLVLVLCAALLFTVALLGVRRASLARTMRRHDIRSVPALLEQADRERWPPLPGAIAGMDGWLSEAEALLARRDRHRAALDGLRRRDPHEHDELVEHLAALPRLSAVVRDVQLRRADALTIASRTIDDHRRAWDRAILTVGDEARNPLYGGLRLQAQVGLVPVGQDPTSRLFEFAHVQTGEIPTRDPQSGRLQLTERTGLVLVLVPGGSYTMGSMSEGTDDAETLAARRGEHPAHRVTLDPFFISKYEMTQGQWLRVTGVNPGSAPPERADAPEARTPACPLLLPVDQVSWQAAERTMSRLGLELPTEAQWEYAARAGTTTTWWTGDDPASLRGAANLGEGRFDPSSEAEQDLGDGWRQWSSPIGSYRPNAFGLHDVHGNVAELVRDWYGSYELPVRPGDGLRRIEGSRLKVARGGTWSDPASSARSSGRTQIPPTARWRVGVRPARAMTRGDS